MTSNLERARCFLRSIGRGDHHPMFEGDAVALEAQFDIVECSDEHPLYAENERLRDRIAYLENNLHEIGKTATRVANADDAALSEGEDPR